MNKLVNVYPSGPIMSLNIPIRTRVMNFVMDTADIRKCLMSKAIVEEILRDNSVIRLDLFNYDKDNNIKEAKTENPVHVVKSIKEVVKPEPKIEVPEEDAEKVPVEEEHVDVKEDVEPEVHAEEHVDVKEDTPKDTEKTTTNNYSNRKNRNKK